VVIEFFIELIEQGMYVTSAWLDSSYDNCLSDAARNFPSYPLKDVRDPRKHWAWWVIKQNEHTIAICNIDTSELILSSGDRYKVSDVKKALQICNIQYIGKLEEWSDAISDTQILLDANDEWRERYSKYAKSITANMSNIKSVRKTFREWDPLKLYLNITNAKTAKSAVRFELRYLGQTVADLKGSSKMKLNTVKYNKTNLRAFDCTLSLTDTDWVSPAASEFRRYFKNLASTGRLINPGNEEHRYESLLLTEMLKTKNKALPYMKPVTIGGVRLPMPTGTDGLVSLRGPENLCMDIFDNPEHINPRIKEVNAIHFKVLDEINDIISKKQEGSTNWMSIWHPKKNWYVTSSDFSCFISKENFEEHVIPGLEEELDKLPASIYHLDGPGALHHMDRLLELKKLNGIQWVQGAGAPPAREWIQIYKKIQKAGKCIQAHCEPEDIEPLCKELEPEGVHLVCYAKTEQEAKDLIALAEKTCKAKKNK